jgi:hypothetical protein
MVTSGRALASTTTSDSGTRRLLWDCETIGRSLRADHPSARGRLEAELGKELTRLLLATLRESEPSTPHEEALRRAAYGGAA